MRQPRITPWVACAAIGLAVGLGLLALRDGRADHASVPDGTVAPWRAHLRAVDDALGRQDVGGAERAWHAGFGVALGSRAWEGMLEVGHASLRIGDVTGIRKTAAARARDLYLAALFRARQHGSLDGVLRAAEAFAVLGDREVATQSIRIAEGLAAQDRDPRARERVRELGARLAGWLAGATAAEQAAL